VSANCVGITSRYCGLYGGCVVQALREGWVDSTGAPGCGQYGNYLQCGTAPATCTYTTEVDNTNYIGQQACH
jgi:hypothetical protein